MEAKGKQGREVSYPKIIRFAVHQTKLALVVALGLAAIVLSLHQTFSEYRSTIVLGASVAGAILALYGVLVAADNIYQRNQEKRVAAALRFAERWNDPNFADLKRQWRMLLVEREKIKPAEQVVELLENDVDKRSVVVDVLNFFEELAISVDSGLADEEMARRYFRTTAVQCFATWEPWVRAYRDKRVRHSTWKELETLTGEWKDL